MSDGTEGVALISRIRLVERHVNGPIQWGFHIIRRNEFNNTFFCK